MTSSETQHGPARLLSNNPHGGPLVVGTIPVGNGPYGAAYDAAKGEIFITNDGSNNVSVINDTTDSVVATVPIPYNPFGVTYDGAKGEVFVTSYSSDTVSVINDTTDAVVATVAVGPGPSVAAYDRAKGEVFITNAFSNDVSVISDTTDTVVATVRVGSGPQGEVYDPATGQIFVANQGPTANNVSVINDTTDTVVATVPVGLYPQSVAYDGAKGEVFVADGSADNVTVINDTTDKVVATVPIGAAPQGEAYDPATGNLFITDSWPGNVSVMSDTTDTVEATVPVGTGPYGVTYDAAKRQVFVTNSGSNNVSVIGYLPNYTVTFSESGLTTKASEKKLATYGWTVVLDGISESSTANAISFARIVNGTYPVLITGPSGIDANGSGTVTVRGTTSVPVGLLVGRTMTLTFLEKGLPGNQGWGVALDGASVFSTTSRARFVNLAAGTYSYSVVSPLGGQNITRNVGTTMAYGPNGTITLAGSAEVRLTFVYRYWIEFTETGLTGGAWSVTVNGETRSSAAPSLMVFTLANGTYHYRASATGYKVSRGEVIVTGADQSVAVIFTSRTS